MATEQPERRQPDERPAARPHRVAHRRDLTYQFPVYRWLAWLVVAGYAIGLGFMYLLAGMFGLPAPLTWAFLVVLFFAGIALLERPKALLICMMFFFLLMPSNRILGLVGVPLPGFLDELFFVPFVAVIVMSWIQRSSMPKGMWFAMSFCLLAGLSWYANGKPSPTTTVQVTLIMLKFFILWYFCRLVAPFRSLKDFWTWGEFYIHYAAVQFLYNCLWQGGPWVRHHWDNSGGVFGPEGSGAAHLVGYISIIALFLLAAWWVGEGRKASAPKRWWMALMGLVIAYDLIFMTDTKHALAMAPVAFFPVLFHRSIALKTRLALLTVGGAFVVVAVFYIATFTNSANLHRFATVMADSPKGEAYLAVTKDFRFLVPYPVLGAGPGRFFSSQAVDAMAPLARRYVIPYYDEIQRSQSLHVSGSRTGGSLLAYPAADILTLTGEFGWCGMGLYASFLVFIWVGLWRKANRWTGHFGGSFVFLSLGASVVFLFETMFFYTTSTIPSIVFPLWMLIGRVWDLEPPEESGEASLPLPEDGDRAFSEFAEPR